MQEVLDTAKHGKAWLMATLKDYSKLEKFFLACFSIILIGYFCFSATMQRNFIYLAAPFLLFYLWNNRKFGIYRQTSWLWASLALFWSYNLASVFWSAGADVKMFGQIARFELMAVLFTCGLATLIARHPSSWTILYHVYFYAALISGVVLFLYTGGHTLMTHSELVRLRGFGRTGNSNLCAALYSVAIIFLLYAPRDERPLKHSVARVAALTLFIVLVVWTMGRGPILALLIVFIAMALWQRQYKFLAGLTAIYAATAAFVLWNPADWGDIMKRGDDNRFVIWRQAADLAKGDPAFGIGIGTRLRFPVPGMTEIFDSSHNLFLGSFVYGGAVGLVLVLLVLAAMIFYGIRLTMRSLDGSVAALILFGLVFFMFETRTLVVNVNTEWLFTYLPIAVIAGFLGREKLKAGLREISADA